MPSPSSRTHPRGYETGPGPLHYKLRAKTVDTDILGMVYLADGAKAPVYLDKCGRRMHVVPEIAREGWVRTYTRLGSGKYKYKHKCQCRQYLYGRRNQ